jgi:hypothetical protein
MSDVIITGLPRAGSTIVSALIDTIPDAVSLNAPIAASAVAQRTYEVMPYCKWLVGEFVWTRRMFLDMEPVGDLRAPDGMPLTDGLYDPRQKFKELRVEGSDKPVQEPELTYFIRQGLSPDFTLAIRHHSLFTSILPSLVKFKHFKVIAVIRHPLDVLTSWRKLPKPVLGKGNPHGISRFWPEALAIMESKTEMADRMVQLYDAFLGRYHELREHIHIVKYEDILERPHLISKLLGTRAIPDEGLAMIEHRASTRVASEIKVFRERIRKYGVFTKLYYTDI